MDVRDAVARGELVVADETTAQVLRFVSSVTYDPEEAEWTVLLNDSQVPNNFGSIAVMIPASAWEKPRGPGSSSSSGIPQALGCNIFNPANGDGEHRWRTIRSVLQHSDHPAGSGD